MLQFKVRVTSSAMTSLYSVQKLFVFWVIIPDNCVNICPFRYVCPHQAAENNFADFLLHALFHQFSGFWRKVNANPLPLLHFSRNASGGASAEWV